MAFKNRLQTPPAKSSLSKFRKKISYKFFKNIFYSLTSSFEQYRETFRGRRIYAIDGKWAYIPRSNELLQEGFQGRKVSDWHESYQLRLHLTHAYDVLSGVSKGLRVSKHQDEIANACDMIKEFETGPILLRCPKEIKSVADLQTVLENDAKVAVEIDDPDYVQLITTNQYINVIDHKKNQPKRHVQTNASRRASSKSDQEAPR